MFIKKRTAQMEVIRDNISMQNATIATPTISSQTDSETTHRKISTKHQWFPRIYQAYIKINIFSVVVSTPTSLVTVLFEYSDYAIRFGIKSWSSKESY